MVHPLAPGGLPSVCILAGGLGTRLGERSAHTPKALIEVAGAPFALHQLALLARAGATHVVFCVGHLGGQIEERIGARRFGIAIDYSYDQPALDGTLGALRRAAPLLGARFLYLYGDTYLRIDYATVNAAWRTSALPALMTVIPATRALGAPNATFDGHLVRAYDKATPQPAMGHIDYGLGGFVTTVLGEHDNKAADLASLHRQLARSGQLFGYEAHRRFYEIGTEEALKQTQRFLVEERRRFPFPLEAGGQRSSSDTP